MARNETVVLVDDLDGTEGAKKRKFMLDGISYEADLTDENYLRLQDAFAPYIEAARRVPRKRNNGAAKLARTKK